MTVHVTYFDAVKHSDATGYAGASNARGVFSAQLGDAEALEPGGHGSVNETRGRYALVKVTDDCRIDVRPADAAAGASSGVWLAGEVDVRFVAAGQRLSVAVL